MTGYLELEGVGVSFNGFRAVDGLNLSVRQGELRCLIGPNGAGKTTALDMICGKTKPTSGTIRLGETVLNRLEEHQIARAGIGRKFQVPSVFKELTVRDNLSVAMSRTTGVFANLFKFGRDSDLEDLHRLADLVGLGGQMDLPAGHLSHGQTQWLEIALLLAQDPDVILMDEPTAGMTAQETKKTADLFKRLRGRHTLIVVEHDMGFVKEIGDRISVMHQGRMLAEGSVEEIENDPKVREAYLGSGGISGA
ncbi:MAG: urea ABC transporter ATP-binding protein UrtD [Alphaproteobacteria bacterium]|nr:urea ABC transporter ATP-binding protein UrtD [Alphaproteobacteria bacterium]MDX5370448.1 urea ABC transporter ATP-binding protein UrtD [Alphaproteobacteria bacterium]MDX5464954.1 urea ABC transporter ATP-binding protein UrtD [Alphaproteobacteria bacterium]